MEPQRPTLGRKLAPGAIGLVAVGALIAFANVHKSAPATGNTLLAQNEGLRSMASTSLEEASSSTAPHIVFFLVDDMGYNDIGYQSSDIPNASPFLDELAAQGVKLTRYYTEFECTPARAALMTGKLPIKTGMQHECITPTSPFGLRSEEATMADHLKDGAGYSTHIVGKWDLGHYALELWPTHRGFDTFFGLACYGYDDYFTHDNKGFWDLHDWSMVEGRHNPDETDFGTYSTFLFGKRATDIVQAHPQSSPLLLYVPFNAVHNFLSVPAGWNETEIAKVVVGDVSYGPRQKFAGALYLMDQECKSIVGALKAKGMYEHSVVVLASDNGGSPIDGGNNWPLRGAKKTMFEGGHRVPCFVHSPLLSKEVRGSSFHGLMHVVDWVPTLVLGAADLAGVVSQGRQDAFDGYNLWGELNKVGGSSPRKELLLNIDYVTQSDESSTSTSTDSDGDTPVDDITKVWMGLTLEIEGTLYKLILNQFDYSYYVPLSNQPWGDVQQAYSDYLFDVSADENEEHNLLEHMEISEKAYPMEHIIQELSVRMCHHYDQMVPSQYKGSDKQGKKAMESLHSGWVTHWATYDDTVQDTLKLSAAPKCNADVLAKHLYSKREDTVQEGTAEDDELGNVVPAQNPDDPFDPDAEAAPTEESESIAALVQTKKAKLARVTSQARQTAIKNEAAAAAASKKNAKAGASKAMRIAKMERKDTEAAAESLAKIVAA